MRFSGGSTSASMYRSLYLDPCPPSLRVPAVAGLERKLQIRPEAAEQAAVEPAPAWLARLPSVPT